MGKIHGILVQLHALAVGLKSRLKCPRGGGDGGELEHRKMAAAAGEMEGWAARILACHGFIEEVGSWPSRKHRGTTSRHPTAIEPRERERIFHLFEILIFEIQLIG